MPMYEYSCVACAFEDTLLEKIGASVTKKCPACGKVRGFKRQLSAPSFHLKGTGWYVTDFRDGKGAKDAKDSKSDKHDKSNDSAKSTSSEGKTDTAKTPAAASAKAPPKVKETAGD